MEQFDSVSSREASNQLTEQKQMSEQKPIENDAPATPDIRDIVKHAIQEYVQAEHRKTEPAYKAELQEERKRREGLEGRLNLLVEENRKARVLPNHHNPRRVGSTVVVF